jgi:dTDP-4-dehydrorhamnose reductase
MIVVIGGTGILGNSLKSSDETLICLNSEFDVFEFTKLEKKLDELNPSIIIHCAAIKSEKVIIEPIKSINVNIIGTSNISKYCIEKNKRLVYISTDYIYSGKKGMYKEEDEILPFNIYAWTKLGGESSVMLVKNHLIIRTSFGESKFPYKSAFTNLITSKDYVDIISPMILKSAKSNLKGILNIGTEPKSIYEFALRRNVVESSTLSDSKNFSLNTNRYERIFGNHNLSNL